MQARDYRAGLARALRRPRKVPLRCSAACIMHANQISYNTLKSQSRGPTVTKHAWFQHWGKLHSLRHNNSTHWNNPGHELLDNLTGEGDQRCLHPVITQRGDKLVHCVTFLRNCKTRCRALCPAKILSLTMMQIYGGEVTPDHN